MDCTPSCVQVGTKSIKNLDRLQLHEIQVLLKKVLLDVIMVNECTSDDTYDRKKSSTTMSTQSGYTAIFNWQKRQILHEFRLKRSLKIGTTAK